MCFQNYAVGLKSKSSGGSADLIGHDDPNEAKKIAQGMKDTGEYAHTGTASLEQFLDMLGIEQEVADEEDEDDGSDEEDIAANEDQSASV